MNNKTIIGIIMTAILTLGFLLTSCRPDPKDGIYHPKKHITSIVTGSSNDDTISMEIWNWKGKSLQSIDHYRHHYYSHQDPIHLTGTEQYYYNDDNRLSKIVFNDIVTDFAYDGSNLSTVTIKDEGYTSLYKLGYEKSKLSTITLIDLKRCMKNDDLHASIRSLMTLPMELSLEHFLERAERHQKRGDHDTVVIHVEWKGDNVSKFWSVFEDERETVTFTYDNKTNPFCGFFHYCYIVDEFAPETFRLGCKNNVLSITGTTEEDGSLVTESEVVNFEYTYKRDYPTSVSYPNNSPHSGIAIRRYEYE